MGAATIQVTDSIESSGFPLGFKVKQGNARPGVVAGSAARDMFKVEARAMGGHQKEAVVTEGEAGSAWRMVSDEGANLKGSDLAPFPLGFFNASLQADLIGRIERYAQAHRIALDSVAVDCLNRYAFQGSFFKGDGRGSAEPARLVVKLASSADAATIGKLVRAAVKASPALAACRTAFDNTFALYINGRRREVTQAKASKAPDAPDPLKVYKGVPRPLAGAQDLPDLIAKMPAPAAAAPATPMPAVAPGESVKFDIHIAGVGRPGSPRGTVDTEVWPAKPLGSRFAIRSDERAATGPGQGDQGPSALALQAGGVAFCLMTQLLRYTEYHKFNIRAIRVVQYSPYALTGSLDDWSLAGAAEPYDTHLMVHGEEPDETMERLMIMAANTCYLHASLHAALAPEVSIELNGAPVA